jgi:hypothetical protein
MDSGVINFDDLPDDNPLPKAVNPQALGAINFDDLPDEAMPVQPEPSGILAGIGSGVVRSYNENRINSGIAEKFRLQEYKTSLEQGGEPETEISDLVLSNKATPAQVDLLFRGVPKGDPIWKAAELARVTNEMGKLDQSIKKAEATKQNYPEKSAVYQGLQGDIETAKKEGRPIMGTLEALWNNKMAVPEFVAEGAYGTAKPIVGAIGSAIALRKGKAAPLAQTLGPIAASMGLTGIDSYKGEVAQIIESKAREGGIDLRKNPEMMGELLQDSDFIDAVKTDALKAGLNDAAWAGISTWLGMTPKIKGIWQPVVQSVAEAGTEASKQLVTKGTISDPSNVIMSGVAGAAFEGPSYGIARAAGAFGKATPPPAPGAQAQPAAAPAAPVAPQPINADDLPSVAGETAEAPAAPAPVAVAPVQPELPTQPASTQPQAVAPAPAPVAEPAPVAPVQPVTPVAVQPEPTPAPAPQPVATAQPEAKPVAPVAPAAQTEIPGTAETFNLTGEQVTTPAPKAVDTTAEMPLPETRENPLATEARSRLAKLEAAGKGDSDQAKALRRTIERESNPAAPAVEQKPKGMTVEIMGKKYPVASMQEASAKWLSATKQIEDNGVSLNRDTGLQENLWSGDGPVVRDADGKILGYIAQNGSIKKNRNSVGAGNDIYVPTDADYDAAGYPPRQEQAAKPSGEEPAEVKAARKVIENPKSIDELNNAWDTVFKYEKKGKYAIETAPKPAQVAEQAQTEPAPIPSTPEREAKINAILDNAEATDQSYTYEIKPIYQLKGSDGKWYRPQGFPFGIRNTGEKRIEGYAAHSKEGISYGKTYATEAEANAAAEAGRKARREEFRKSLEQSDNARLDEQTKFWEGERATFDRRNPEAALRRQKPAQPAPSPVAEVKPVQSPQAEVAPVAKAEPVAEQPKAAPAKKPEAREKKPDATTGEPYEVTVARRRVDNPKTNRSRYIEAVRVLDQYENDQKLSDYDKTVDLDKTSDEAITEFLDAHGKRPEYEVSKAESDYAESVSDYAAKRFGSETGQRGDLLADMRDLAKKGVALPVLPKWMNMESGRTFADIIAGKMPGVLAQPPLLKADEKRARTDGEYRKEIKMQFEDMAEKYAESLSELGWTQVSLEKNGWDELVDLISRATNGEKLVPQGGVQSFRKAKEGNPRAYSTGPDANVNPDPNQQADEEMDIREPEPAPEQVAESVAIEAEYGEPRFDAEPTPAEQVILDAAADSMPTEESILDALDKAAAERLDPKNRSSIGPDLIAALTWQTARDIQKGLTNFAKWAADKARQFPGIKGSLKAIWAKAQDIAKRPIDYIRFRALDSIADKVWQNVGRNKGSATLRKIANMVFAKYGPDADATDNDIPTRVNLVRTQFSNIYAGISERFAAEFADMTPEQRRQWDVDFRKHVIDGTTPTDPKLAKAVKDFRNLMRDLLAYQREAGIEMGDQGVNYFPRNYDPDAVEADRPGFVKAAIEMYRRMGERMYAKIMAEPITQEEIDTRAESLKDKDDKAGTTLRSDNEYKRIAEIQLEQTRQERADKYNFSPDDLLQKAEDWATAITHGDVLGLTLFKASEGKITSDSTDARTFNNDEAKLADEFLKKNVDDIMMGYIDGAVRGAELARVFGEDGKMFEQMMNKLSKEGVDAETVKETRRLVQKALGVGREQSSKATAVFFDWVNVVLAAAFLGKTFTYNLVLEPISFGIRTGNVYLALKGMADTWKYTIAEVFANPSPAMRQRIEAKYGSRFKFEKAVTETVGEQVGLIQREMERAYLNSHWDYSAGEKGSKMAKWLSQRIYRANLMSATEKAKVQASIGIARLALRDNARFLTGDAPIQKIFAALGMDANADKSAAVIMRENGVPEADHKAFAAFVASLEGKTDAEWQSAVLDPNNKMAKHYRRALQRMSLGMSIKTNQSLKMEMSDSILGRMLMQLMNYSYAYSNLVKDRMYSMAAETVAKDASKIDRLRYAAPLLVGAPLAILGAAASKALIAAMWPSDDEEKRSKETPMLRKAFNWASFAGMFGPKIEYLFKSFERGQAPGGPVGETIFRGGQAAFAAASDPESDKKAYNARKQLYNSTVKPLVTGSAAAVHPFFGFLGNAAVNTQTAREAVVGEKPKK